MKHFVYIGEGLGRVGPLLGAIFLLAVQGCGGGEGGDELADAEPIELPSPPSAGECGGRRLTKSGASAGAVPRAGTYEYSLRGKETVGAAQGGAQSLPPRMPVVVTPALRRPHFACFRLQRRLRPSLVETATIVVHNDDLYVSELTLDTADGSTVLSPRPLLLAAPSDGLEWSGVFAGDTRGRYTGRLLGRRRVSVGGDPMPAVGVEVKSAFAGQVTGTQRSTQWFSTEDYLLLRERNVEERRFGLDDLKVAYTARLIASGAEESRQ